MSPDDTCCICGLPAVVDIPKVICEECYQYWLKVGYEAIDQGCPIASKRLEDHIDACDLCCEPVNDFNYCAIGESLSESWLETMTYTDDSE